MKHSTRIIFLRHGEPRGNPESSEKIFRGITDDELTARGWQQMAEALKTIPRADIIYASPLKRCADFARQTADKYAVPLQLSSGLKEIDFGAWEGRTVTEIAGENAQLLENFWQDPVANTPPDGEPVAKFQQRVITFWYELLQAQQGKTCLLIAHGGVQKMILSEVLQMPLSAIHNIELSYACWSVFSVYYDGTEAFVSLKSHSHLEDIHINE